MYNDVEWLEGAACKGLWDSVKYWWDGRKDDDAMRQYLTLCSTCPVKGKCLETASNYDLAHTVRAGRLPSDMMESRTPAGRGMLASGKCTKGIHEIADPTDLATNGACRMCKNEDRRLRREAEPVPRIHPNSAKTHCKHGHEFSDENTGWKSHSRGRMYRFCKTCQAEYHRNYRYGKMAA